MTKDEAIDMLNVVIDSLSHPDSESDFVFFVGYLYYGLKNCCESNR